MAIIHWGPRLALGSLFLMPHWLSASDARAAEIIIEQLRAFDNKSNGDIDTVDSALENNLEDGPPIICNLRLRDKRGVDGKVVEGISLDDVAKLKQAFAKFAERGIENRVRLCLESSGGSYAGGLEIARFLIDHSIGTAIELDKVCASSCAFIFMAGTHQQAKRLNRFMHPTSKLEFHAPYLDDSLQIGKKSPAETYRDAIEGIARLVLLGNDHVPNFFPTELLLQTLARGPNETYKIDTVGKVVRFRIHLFGGRVPILSESALCSACTNHFWGGFEKYGLAGKEPACRKDRGRLQQKTFPQGVRVQPDVDASGPRGKGGICVIDVTKKGGADSAWFIHVYDGSEAPFASGFMLAYWYLYAPDTQLHTVARR